MDLLTVEDWIRRIIGGEQTVGDRLFCFLDGECMFPIVRRNLSQGFSRFSLQAGSITVHRNPSQGFNRVSLYTGGCYRSS